MAQAETASASSINIERVRELMAAGGWTQMSLAVATGRHINVIGRLVRGDTKHPDVILVRDVANVLGVTVEELLA